MDIKQLEYLISIVKNESFTKTANEMFISQSSLSKKIQSLEEELELKLLNRNKSQIKLTDPGKEVYKFAKVVLDEQIKLDKALEEYRHLYKTNINFASIPILSYYEINSFFADFSSNYLDKRIYFNIIEMNQRFVIRLLDNNDVDIALIRDSSSIDLSKYDYIDYYIDEFVLVCNKEHELAKKDIVELEEISKYPFILMDKTSNLNNIILNELKRLNIDIVVKNIVSRHNLVLEMVSKNLGISLLPKKLLENIHFDNIAYKSLYTPIKSKLLLLKKKDQLQNSITNEFWKYCKLHIDMGKENI